MTVERIESGFFIAPDFKITEFDSQTSGLAGFYGGWLEDKTFLIGGAGYWLTDWSHNRGMGYGGLVVGWLVHTDRRVGFAAKSLIGGGQATLLGQVLTYVPSPPPVVRPRTPPTLVPVTATVHFHDDFFVFEPEANVFATLGRHLRLTGGVSYRVVAGTERSDIDNRIRGLAGTVGLQIGP